MKKQSYFLYLKSIALTLILCLVLQEFSYAFPELLKSETLAGFTQKSQKQKNMQWAKKFLPQIPESVATIEDAWKAGDKTIILIQDAHTNPSCQLNESKLFSILFQNKITDTVYTEAAKGNVNLTFLRDKASLSQRMQIAQEYLQKGLLHGIEYLDITGDEHFKVEGVEEPELYFESLKVYRQSVDKRKQFEQYLMEMQSTIHVLKPKLLNPFLLGFLEKYEKAQSAEADFSQYIDTLFSQAEILKIELGEFQNLRHLKALKKMESGIDFIKANQEQRKAVAALSIQDQKELGELSASKLSLKDSQKGYFVLLKEKLINSARHSSESWNLNETSNRAPYDASSKPAGMTNAYPELTKYFSYLEKSNTLDTKEILVEKKRLEDQIFKALTTNEDESKLLLADRVLVFYDKLFHLTLTPEEFEEFYQEKFTELKSISGFLNEKLMLIKDHYDKAIFLNKDFSAMAELCKRFYELTKQRDEKFLENMFSVSTVSASILITGGYHTPNLKYLLKKKNISYISIVPQVLHETNVKRYEEIILDQSVPVLPKPASISAVGKLTMNAYFAPNPLGSRMAGELFGRFGVADRTPSFSNYNSWTRLTKGGIGMSRIYFGATASGDEEHVAKLAVRGRFRSLVKREASLSRVLASDPDIKALMPALIHSGNVTKADRQILPALKLGEPYLVREKAKGRSLDEHISFLRSSPFHAKEAIQVLADISHALVILHTPTDQWDAVYHRDLKPQDIFVNKHGFSWDVTFVDWGLATIEGLRMDGISEDFSEAGLKNIPGVTGRGGPIWQFGTRYSGLSFGAPQHRDIQALTAIIQDYSDAVGKKGVVGAFLLEMTQKKHMYPTAAFYERAFRDFLRDHPQPFLPVGARMVKYQGAILLSEIIKLSYEDLQKKIAASQLPILTGEDIGVTDKAGQIVFVPEPNYRYRWSGMGLKEAGYTARVMEQGIEDGKFWLKIRFQKGDDENSAIVRTFDVSPETVASPYRGAGEKRATLKFLTLAARPERPALDVISKIITAPDDFDFEKEKDSFKKLVGMRVDITKKKGQIFFNPVPNFNYPWSPLSAGEGYEGHVTEQWVRNNELYFAVRFKKEKHPDILKTFKIGAERTDINHTNGASQKMSVRNITPYSNSRRFGDFLSSPSTGPIKDLAATFPSFKGLILGRTQYQGCLKVWLDEDVSYKANILGKAIKGYTVTVEDQGVEGEQFYFDFKFTKDNSEIIRRYYVSNEFKETHGRRKQEGVVRYARKLLRFPANDSLTKIILLPEDKPLKDQAFLTSALLGQVFSLTDGMGRVYFRVAPKKFYRWKALPNGRKGYRGVILRNGFIGGVFYFDVLFNKPNERSFAKRYYIGSRTRLVDDVTVRRVTQRPARHELARILTDTQKDDFTQMNIPDLTGLSLGHTGISGNYFLNPFPNSEYNWRALGQKIAGASGKIVHFKVFKDRVDLQVEFKYPDQDLTIIRSFMITHATREISDLSVRSEVRKRTIHPILNLESQIDPRDLGRISGEGGQFFDQNPRAEDSVHEAMLSELSDIVKALSNSLPVADKNIMLLLMEGNSDEDIVLSNPTEITNADVVRVKDQLRQRLRGFSDGSRMTASSVKSIAILKEALDKASQNTSNNSRSYAALQVWTLIEPVIRRELGIEIDPKSHATFSPDVLEGEELSKFADALHELWNGKGFGGYLDINQRLLAFRGHFYPDPKNFLVVDAMVRGMVRGTPEDHFAFEWAKLVKQCQHLRRVGVHYEVVDGQKRALDHEQVVDTARRLIGIYHSMDDAWKQRSAVYSRISNQDLFVWALSHAVDPAIYRVVGDLDPADGSIKPVKESSNLAGEYIFGDDQRRSIFTKIQKIDRDSHEENSVIEDEIVRGYIHQVFSMTQQDWESRGMRSPWSSSQFIVSANIIRQPFFQSTIQQIRTNEPGISNTQLITKLAKILAIQKYRAEASLANRYKAYGLVMSENSLADLLGQTSKASEPVSQDDIKIMQVALGMIQSATHGEEEARRLFTSRGFLSSGEAGSRLAIAQRPIVDLSPDAEKEKEWIDAQPTVLLKKLAAFIVKHITYITQAMFEEKLKKSVEAFNKACSNDFAVCMIGDASPEEIAGQIKSNGWTYQMANEMGLRKPKSEISASKEYVGSKTVAWLKQDENKTVNDLLYVDDAAYSGRQIADDFLSSLGLSLMRDQAFQGRSITVHFAIPYMTKNAMDKLRTLAATVNEGAVKPRLNLVFYDPEIIRNVKEIFAEADSDVRGEFERIFEGQDQKALTYFQHKKPDGFSAPYVPFSDGTLFDGPVVDEKLKVVRRIPFIPPVEKAPYQKGYLDWIQKHIVGTEWAGRVHEGTRLATTLPDQIQEMYEHYFNDEEKQRVDIDYGGLEKTPMRAYQANLNLLRIIVFELLANALDHSDKAQRVKLQFKQINGKWLDVTVSNHGNIPWTDLREAALKTARDEQLFHRKDHPEEIRTEFDWLEELTSKEDHLDPSVFEKTTEAQIRALENKDLLFISGISAGKQAGSHGGAGIGLNNVEMLAKRLGASLSFEENTKDSQVIFSVNGMDLNREPFGVRLAGKHNLSIQDLKKRHDLGQELNQVYLASNQTQKVFYEQIDAKLLDLKITDIRIGSVSTLNSLFQGIGSLSKIERILAVARTIDWNLLEKPKTRYGKTKSISDIIRDLTPQQKRELKGKLVKEAAGVMKVKAGLLYRFFRERPSVRRELLGAKILANTASPAGGRLAIYNEAVLAADPRNPAEIFLQHPEAVEGLRLMDEEQLQAINETTDELSLIAAHTIWQTHYSGTERSPMPEAMNHLIDTIHQFAENAYKDNDSTDDARRMLWKMGEMHFDEDYERNPEKFDSQFPLLNPLDPLSDLPVMDVGVSQNAASYMRQLTDGQFILVDRSYFVEGYLNRAKKLLGVGDNVIIRRADARHPEEFLLEKPYRHIRFADVFKFMGDLDADYYSKVLASVARGGQIALETGGDDSMTERKKSALLTQQAMKEGGWMSLSGTYAGFVGHQYQYTLLVNGSRLAEYEVEWLEPGAETDARNRMIAELDREFSGKYFGGSATTQNIRVELSRYLDSEKADYLVDNLIAGKPEDYKAFVRLMDLMVREPGIFRKNLLGIKKNILADFPKLMGESSPPYGEMLEWYIQDYYPQNGFSIYRVGEYWDSEGDFSIQDKMIYSLATYGFTTSQYVELLEDILSKSKSDRLEIIRLSESLRQTYQRYVTWVLLGRFRDVKALYLYHGERSPKYSGKSLRVTDPMYFANNPHYARQYAMGDDWRSVENMKGYRGSQIIKVRVPLEQITSYADDPIDGKEDEFSLREGFDYEVTGVTDIPLKTDSVSPTNAARLVSKRLRKAIDKQWTEERMKDAALILLERLAGSLKIRSGNIYAPIGTIRVSTREAALFLKKMDLNAVRLNEADTALLARLNDQIAYILRMPESDREAELSQKFRESEVIKVNIEKTPSSEYDAQKIALRLLREVSKNVRSERELPPQSFGRRYSLDPIEAIVMIGQHSSKSRLKEALEDKRNGSVTYPRIDAINRHIERFFRGGSVIGGDREFNRQMNRKIRAEIVRLNSKGISEIRIEYPRVVLVETAADKKAVGGRLARRPDSSVNDFAATLSQSALSAEARELVLYLTEKMDKHAQASAFLKEDKFVFITLIRGGMNAFGDGFVLKTQTRELNEEDYELMGDALRAYWKGRGWDKSYGPINPLFVIANTYPETDEIFKKTSDAVYFLTNRGLKDRLTADWLHGVHTSAHIRYEGYHGDMDVDYLTRTQRRFIPDLITAQKIPGFEEDTFFDAMLWGLTIMLDPFNWDTTPYYGAVDESQQKTKDLESYAAMSKGLYKVFENLDEVNEEGKLTGQNLSGEDIENLLALVFSKDTEYWRSKGFADPWTVTYFQLPVDDPRADAGNVFQRSLAKFRSGFEALRTQFRYFGLKKRPLSDREALAKQFYVDHPLFPNLKQKIDGGRLTSRNISHERDGLLVRARRLEGRESSRSLGAKIVNALLSAEVDENSSGRELFNYAQQLWSLHKLLIYEPQWGVKGLVNPLANAAQHAEILSIPQDILDAIASNETDPTERKRQIDSAINAHYGISLDSMIKRMRSFKASFGGDVFRNELSLIPHTTIPLQIALGEVADNVEKLEGFVLEGLRIRSGGIIDEFLENDFFSGGKMRSRDAWAAILNHFGWLFAEDKFHRSELSSEDQRNFTQFDEVSHPVFITHYDNTSDASGQRIIYVNQAFLDMVRMPDGSNGNKEDWIGKTYVEKNPTELAEQYTADDLEALKKAKGEHLYKTESNESGEKPTTVETVKLPYYDSKGELIGVLAMFTVVEASASAKEMNPILRQTLDGVLIEMGQSGVRLAEQAPISNIDIYESQLLRWARQAVETFSNNQRPTRFFERLKSYFTQDPIKKAASQTAQDILSLQDPEVITGYVEALDRLAQIAPAGILESKENIAHELLRVTWAYLIAYRSAFSASRRGFLKTTAATAVSMAITPTWLQIPQGTSLADLLRDGVADTLITVNTAIMNNAPQSGDIFETHPIVTLRQGPRDPGRIYELYSFDTLSRGEITTQLRNLDWVNDMAARILRMPRHVLNAMRNERPGDWAEHMDGFEEDIPSLKSAKKRELAEAIELKQDEVKNLQASLSKLHDDTIASSMHQNVSADETYERQKNVLEKNITDTKASIANLQIQLDYLNTNQRSWLDGGRFSIFEDKISETISFLINVSNITGKTGTLVVGSVAFEIQKETNGSLAIYVGEEKMDLESFSYKENTAASDISSEAFNVSISMADLKLILDAAYKKTKDIELKNIQEIDPAALEIDLDHFNSGQGFNEAILPVLIEEILYARRQGYGTNAKFLIKGKDAQKVADELNKQKAGTAYTDQEALPDGYEKNKIFLTTPEAELPSTVSKRFFMQKPGTGDIPNFRAAFKLSIAIARIENDKLSSTELRTTRISELLEAFIKGIDLDIFVQVVRGQITDPTQIAKFSLPAIIKLPVEAWIQGARMAARFTLQSA